MNSNKTATTNPFINTYIDISNYKKEDVLTLAKKYSQASGLPLNALDEKNNMFEAGYRCLACFPDNKLFRGNGIENVCVTSLLFDNLQILGGFCANQITEQDLDNYLSETKNMSSPLDTHEQCGHISNKYPDFNFKISLENMTEDEEVAAKDWIEEAACARFKKPDVSNLDFDSTFFWVSDYAFLRGGGIGHSDNKVFFSREKTQEVKLSFQASVQSWSKDQSELLKRKAELEEALAKINQELGAGDD